MVTPDQAARRYYPQALLALWCMPIQEMAMPVLDEETGKTFEYQQLHQHPKYKYIWEQSYSNELGRLCQGIVHGTAGPPKKRVAGTETFQVIKHGDTPKDLLKEVTYTKVVCEVRPQKEYPNRTRITIRGNRIIYPGEVATPTASLELVNLIINSVLSCHGVKLSCFIVKNFYLATTMDQSKFVKIKIEDIPQEFVLEYSLITFVHNGSVYFEFIRG